MEDIEKDIIKQLKDGDNEAYKWIYDHHYTVLCDVAYQYLHDAFLAKAMVGDVIFHLWEVRDTLHVSSSLRSYLVRAVRNRCLDHLKSEHAQREVTFSSLTPEDLDADEGRYGLSDNYPLGKLLERELEAEIRTAIRNLPAECRRVFLKSRFEEKKYEEIAEELHISVNTVKYHMKNALSLLQQALGKYLIALLLLFLHLR